MHEVIQFFFYNMLSKIMNQFYKLYFLNQEKSRHKQVIMKLYVQLKKKNAVFGLTFEE
jgi:hypothetical protein